MNKKNFDIMISKFSKVYERVLEPDVLSIYYNLFKEIPDNQVNHIIRECLKKCHYFPRPADIFGHYDEYVLENIEHRRTRPEELEISKKVIRKVRQEFEKIKEPEKIGNIIKEMKIKMGGYDE